MTLLTGCIQQSQLGAPALPILVWPSVAAVPVPVATGARPEPALRPPSPISPRGGVTLEALGGPLSVRLRWAVPQPAVSQRFFVEVLAREAGGNRPIFSAYVRRPEMTLTLPATSGRYAWRVFAVAGAHAHYLPSAWSEFGVDADAAAAGKP